MNALYESLDISKQAVHQYAGRQRVFDSQVSQLILEADELRSAHPGCGVDKMYDALQPAFIGRDRFVTLMMQLGYRLKRKKELQTHHSSLKALLP